MEPYDPDGGGMDTGLFGAIVLSGIVLVLIACCGVAWLLTR